MSTSRRGVEGSRREQLNVKIGARIEDGIDDLWRLLATDRAYSRYKSPRVEIRD